jgi:pimeloyl-ACP methyl ester carboxylesterase
LHKEYDQEKLWILYTKVCDPGACRYLCRITMETHFFTYQKTQLCYLKTGNGTVGVLAFHGFGLDKTAFTSMASYLNAKGYIFYSFDLFFHGDSQWKEPNKVLSKELWKAILEAFLIQEGINQFILMGFSMGGRFAMVTLESFPEKVKELILIAPDGIKTSCWYNLATYPGWMQGLFRWVVTHPNDFRKISRQLRKLRIVGKGIEKFAHLQMQTRQQRLRLYYAWTVFRLIRPERKILVSLLCQRHIPLKMFLGKYDRIITVGNVQRLLRQVPHAQVYLLDSGHNLIQAVSNCLEQQDLL